MMNPSTIASCYIGPEISPEQFIPEHFFLYLTAGTMMVYDSHKEYTIKAGNCGIARRNQLAKYNKLPVDGKFEKVVVVFDQAFLKDFQQQYAIPTDQTKSPDAIIKLSPDPLIENFIQSLNTYFNEMGTVDTDLLDVKRRELLLILLKKNPRLAAFFFDFGAPEKIDLEAYMNRNFRFNVTLDRFAYLTGRSLTSFKQDFKRIFNDTPSRWLVQKRLNEAYFLLDKKGRKASDVYLEVGFENLSHFSFAFKKQFGLAPTQLTALKQ
ncbi:helix-turn-helix domain-containing protein [Fibrella sp. WM1]|uniref:helix-turn-helix domain-containing protein n=1 Tax=Fibrella musci TaxID=3242485 RepID=UPI003520E5E5